MKYARTWFGFKKDAKTGVTAIISKRRGEWSDQITANQSTYKYWEAMIDVVNKRYEAALSKALDEDSDKLDVEAPDDEPLLVSNMDVRDLNDMTLPRPGPAIMRNGKLMYLNLLNRARANNWIQDTAKAPSVPVSTGDQEENEEPEKKR